MSLTDRLAQFLDRVKTKIEAIPQGGPLAVNPGVYGTLGMRTANPLVLLPVARDASETDQLLSGTESFYSLYRRVYFRRSGNAFLVDYPEGPNWPIQLPRSLCYSPWNQQLFLVLQTNQFLPITRV